MSKIEYNDALVSSPPHYLSGNMEVIDVIDAFVSDLHSIEAYDTGNIIKYILRWPHKNGLQDLKKAHWYLEHLINHVESRMLEEELLKEATLSQCVERKIDREKI